MNEMIRPLQSGPVDVVGDVHGELHALLALLACLGYDDDGHHPEGRHLVFVGDLCDRGHDSPGVVRLVRRLVESGHAQAVLGNHELNLLRDEHKEGNGWFYDDAQHRDRRHGKFLSSATISATERTECLAFFASLPLALERGDLRVVHACWHTDSVLRLSAVTTGIRASFDNFESAIDLKLQESGWEDEAQRVRAIYGEQLQIKESAIPPLPAVGRRDAYKQTGNPLRVLTSGLEQACAQPFYSSGEWRFVERVRWWDQYQDEVPVVVGHYWRWAAPVDRAAVDKGGVDLFAGLGIADWHGARGNVFCVDYSVGRRYLEREGRLVLGKATRLGALRFPEKVLVFEDGEVIPTATRLGGD